MMYETGAKNHKEARKRDKAKRDQADKLGEAFWSSLWTC
jgi:hypothetical protein